MVYADFLVHYGMPRRSGRYPWGSGKDPYQHSLDFIGRVQEKRSNKFEYIDEDGKKYTGDIAIAKSMGLTSSEFRNEYSLAVAERDAYRARRIKSLREDGIGWTEIGKELGMNESSVRSLLERSERVNINEAKDTAMFIKNQIDTRGMIDVGKGTEIDLNISRERLDQALHLLESEGYKVSSGRIPQPTNANQKTTQKVIGPPDMKDSDIYDYGNVHSLHEYTSHDDGKTFTKFQYPASLDSKRLMVRYAEEGGLERDGTVEIRRGVPDLSLGESHYSQVRILVDNKKYIKGMAIYSDGKDMPDGVDIIFNTNKEKSKYSKLEVLKDIKNDPDNPFGSTIKPNGQSMYTDKDGKQKLSLINKRADEGDWTDWQDALPSQFLSKQSKALAQKQLDLAKSYKKEEYDEICSLTNPVVKKHLLQKFSDECDAAAVDLKAASLPGQKYHVIIPMNTLKDTEVYAPGYENGTKLALIRYPHGGTFEIPILTVNNKNKQGKEIITKESIDAVGITKKVADRLSGADFDGDTVMCIPTHDSSGKIKIKNKDLLTDLEGFDPKVSYGWDKHKVDKDGVEHYYRNGKEFRVMSDTQKQMGVISNLITDMTLGGANDKELARAVKHSMVVIDAEKHHLDYKQSEIDNDIKSLQHEWQQTVQADGSIKYGGASTLISQAKGQASVLKTQGTPKINIKGEPWYDPSRPEGAYIKTLAKDLYYPDKKLNKKTGMYEIRTEDGKIIKYKAGDKEAASKYYPIKVEDPITGSVKFTSKDGTLTYSKLARTEKSTRMAETDDPYTLVSKAQHPMELLYADYAKSMKDMANTARVEMYHTPNLVYDRVAAKTYAKEVDSLNRKLKVAMSNAPREREAIRRTNADIATKKANSAGMSKDDLKKATQQSLERNRNDVASIKRRERNINITDNEWTAIQSGAISNKKLVDILNNTDVNDLKQRAMPKKSNSLTIAQKNTMKSMRNSDYTVEQIAKRLGVSTSTVYEVLKGK